MPRSPPSSAQLADDLVFNRRPDALARFIEYFEQHAPAGRAGERQPIRWRA